MSQRSVNTVIFDRVKAILSDQLDVDENEITMDSLIADDLGADSIDVVDLIMSLEDEFDMEIPDDQIEGIRTVGDVVRYLEEKQN